MQEADTIESIDIGSHSDADDVQEMIEKIESEAESCLHGFDDKEVNEQKALKLYEKSAKLGSSNSYYEIANIYCPIGEGHNNVKFNKAAEYLLKGAELIDDPASSLCFLILAIHYGSDGRGDALKCKESYDNCLRLVKYHNDENNHADVYASYLYTMFHFKSKFDKNLIFFDYIDDNLYENIISLLNERRKKSYYNVDVINSSIFHIPY